MADRGVLIRGFFMLGFPTETLEEIEATIDYAVNSDLAQAYFFNVVPQPGTPLYDLAMHENAAALQSQTLQEYNANTTWYAAALRRRHAEGHQARVLPVLRPQSAPLAAPGADDALEELREELRAAITLFAWRKRIESQALPEALMPLTRALHAGRGLRDQRGNAQAAARHPVDALSRACCGYRARRWFVTGPEGLVRP